MIKTETHVYCDACDKDITKLYAGSIDILVHNDKIQEVVPEGYAFCMDCMKSFNQWKRDRKFSKGADE